MEQNLGPYALHLGLQREKGLNLEFFLGRRGSTWNSNSLAFPGGNLVTNSFDPLCNGYCSDSFGLRLRTLDCQCGTGDLSRSLAALCPCGVIRGRGSASQTDQIISPRFG